MVKGVRVEPQHAAEMKAAYQLAKVRGKKLLAMFPQYSRSTIYFYATQKINNTPTVDGRKTNKGRPKKLSQQDERQIERCFKKVRQSTGHFTSKRVQVESGVNHVSNRTFIRQLNSLGYRYLRSRKKGLMNQADLNKRMTFCRMVKRLQLKEDFWKSGISLYLDGKGFEHKTNPHDQARAPRCREWRKPGEGLSLGCVAKGKKEGCRNANYMVAISYGKGVVLCKRYEGQITGQKFSNILKSKEFKAAMKKSSNPKGKRMLQDGCPRQNCKLAQKTMDKEKIKLFKIPARSPDLNPIENFFHLASEKLKDDAVELNITKESFTEFCTRVEKTMFGFSVELIDKIIDTMPKRVDMVIAGKGQRIKY